MFVGVVDYFELVEVEYVECVVVVVVGDGFVEVGFELLMIG